MKIAFMFPGQGAQFVGMGADFFNKYKEARKVYEEASKIVEKDIAKMCFEGSIEDLSNTKNTQLAISVTSLAILAVLKSFGIKSSIDVGLSLGEYVALIDSQILSMEDGLKLLERRSYYMQAKAPNEKYYMLAVIGLDANKVEEICLNNKENGFAVPANYNYSGQVVVTVNEDKVEKLKQDFLNAGARKIVKLNTSGPFHTEKLIEASKCYKKDLENVTFNLKENVVIKNIDGSFYTKKDDIKKILEDHIISPVRFDKTIKTMQNEGVDTYIEIGPGKALSGFVKKECKDAKVFNVQKVEDLDLLLQELKINVGGKN